MKLPLAPIACVLALLATAGAAPRARAESARTLRAVVSPGFLPGVPVLVRVEIRDAAGKPAREVWDAEALLTADPPQVGLSPARVVLRNGLGSALVSLSQTAGVPEVKLTAAAGSLADTRSLRNLEGVTMLLRSGETAGPVEEWSGTVHVTAALTVPPGRTLRVHPGTLVVLSGVASGTAGTTITVRGTLESLGTEDAPVTFTALDPARAWGEIRHDGASPSLYRHTVVTRAGRSPGVGHTGTGPAVRPLNSTIRFEDSTIADTVGKSMNASGSSLELHRCLLTRSVMGPEINGTSLTLEDSWVQEMYGTDDNDGIYLHSQRAGQTIAVRRSVFASGDDDAIDTLGSDVTIEDCIVRDFDRKADLDSKGISVFYGDVLIRRCLIVNNNIGVSAKGSDDRGASVRLERCTFARNEVGIQAHDKNGQPLARIRYLVHTSIINAPDAVRTDYPPQDLEIAFSQVSEAWPGAGNIQSDPLFADAQANDYRLQAASPCIDSGDPAAEPDADGTRADMGVFPYLRTEPPEPRFARGRINGDPQLDISDAVALLFHLFAGAAIGCEDSADVDDDGALAVTDVVRLLDHLFRDGPPPEEPAACGVDAGTDPLGCAQPACS